MAKNRVGRPPLPERQRLSAILVVRLTARELRDIKTEAWRRGISTSAVARERLIEDSPLIRSLHDYAQ